MEMLGIQSILLNRDTIERILQEEDQFFLKCHHRPPVGRESEDVVDNAYARIVRMQPLSYVTVSDIYQDMSTHA